MMAEKNIVMQRKTATGYDTYHPETKAGNVRFADGTTVEAHKAETTHIPYAVASGSANTYSVTVSGITSYQEGLAIAVKINVDNTGASTINVNGLGAKSIKKPNGNDVSASNLKAGSIYSMRFNGTNFILQGSDAAGNATPGDVLSGKTFTNDSGEQTGTMPNQGAKVITPGTTNKAIPAGYHNGSGYVVGDVDLVAENIKQGVNIFGVVGNLPALVFQPGEVVLIESPERAAISPSSWTKVKEIEIYYGGIIRLTWDFEAKAIYSSSCRTYVNGIPYGPERSSNVDITYTEDITVNAGDLIQIYVKGSNGSPYVSNVKVKTVSSLFGQVTFSYH